MPINSCLIYEKKSRVLIENEVYLLRMPRKASLPERIRNVVVSIRGHKKRVKFVLLMYEKTNSQYRERAA